MSTGSPSTIAGRRSAVSRLASSPDSPIANEPWSLSRLTISAFTWPVSTIRTIDTVSGVVTRSPPRNSDSMPSRVEVLGDLRSAAVHDDRLEPGVAQEHDVLGERGLQLRAGHRVAAVLDDDDLVVEPGEPRQRVDEGLGLLHRVLDGPHDEYAEFSST